MKIFPGGAMLLNGRACFQRRLPEHHCRKPVSSSALNDWSRIPVQQNNMEPLLFDSGPDFRIDVFELYKKSGVHILEELLVIFRFNNLFPHELHTFNRILVSKVFSQEPGS